MPARSSLHTAVRRPRFTIFAICLALVLGVLAVTAPNDRAAAAGGTYSFFTSSTTPTVKADPDKKATELGMKFKSSVAGTVTGVRFYKSTTNTGTHYGSLWSRTGTRLAYVKFVNETASGWQQATFSAPVTIAANTVYIVSYLAPKGQYAADEQGFAAEKTSGPMTALKDGADGGNGVYRYGTGGGFPQSTYKATNYYVDVIFQQDNVDNEKPTITTKTPADGATGVSRSSVITATFSEPVDPNTISATLTTGTAPNATTVPTTTSYDPTARMLTVRPSQTLANTTVYTVTISGAKDTSPAKNQMDPVTWSFTTASDPGNCPCTIFADAVPAVPSAQDNGAISLGVRFRAATDGYITGLRFYKGATSNGGTHVGSLWTNAGVRLSRVTFTSESGSGWQTATLPAPIQVTKDTTYVASYYAPTGYYSAQNDYFTNTSTTNGPLTALANGIDGLNGVYAYGGESFPTNEYRQTNYFIDVTFDTSAVDGVAPTVVAKSPAANSDGVATTSAVSATFSEPVDANSVSFSLAKDGGAAVAGTTSYDAGSYRATFTPSAALAYSTKYTATVSAKDTAGNPSGSVSWSFTTAAEPAGPPDQGPGGPIAVVTSSANPYSKYYAEILRTEGLNEFAVIDVSTLSASTLAGYDTVIVGDIDVSADQAATLSTWVNGGGNLIAMKPRDTLSSLLGITAAGSPISEGYLKVDPTTKPGAGIVSETIQYHTAADRYTANSGTTTVAALYADATTPATTGSTPNTAVTLRTVGTAGGEAASFSYDLARSIAMQRQGNIAWAGTERDNYSPNGNPNVIRSDDYFFGGSTAKDWIDFNKVAIPQADEQQRLLANLIQTVNRDKKPLPRFWYFPNSYKAVMVATGDDHASPQGTAGRFDQMIANSPSGCSVNDWTCYRYSSYMFNGGPLSDAAASDYVSKGFEVALHTRTTPNDPSLDYSAANIGTIYSQQLAAFKSQYPSVPNPKTVRMHAIAFSDWSSQPKTEVANGIRTDTNYYYFPASWVKDRPGFMTGSGMAMRFTDTDGSIIDNYQAATQLTDESEQSYPYTIDTMLDNALDSTKGYYGSFVANFHTDKPTEPESDALIASAKSHNVPIISAKQLTDWLDGRNASSYSNLSWASNKLTFSVKVGGGANNLVSMIPTAGRGGSTLSTITQNGTTVSFTKSTIKGLEYASFKPTSATYVATYTGGSSSVAVKSTTATTKQVSGKLDSAGVNTGTVQEAPASATTDQTAQVSWTTTKPASSQVLIGTSPDKLSPTSAVAESTTQHEVAIGDLEPSTTYYYRVTSTDSTGQTVTSPATSEAPAKLVTAAADLIAPIISNVLIAPSGANAEVKWVTNELTADGVQITDPSGKTRERQVSRSLKLDHSFTLTDLIPDRTYLIRIGSQDVAGNRTLSTTYRLITPSAGTGQTSAAAFRVGSTSGSATISDAGDGAITLGGAITSSRSGSFTSAILDARRMVDWDRASFGVTLPTGAAGALYVRTGSTSKVDGSWTGWTRVTAADRWRVDAASRFIQYRVDLSAGTGIAAPTVYSMGFSSNSGQVVDVTEGGGEG